MPRAIDMLQCPTCGDWYVPVEREDRRTEPHSCAKGVVSGRFPKLGQIVDMEV